MTELRKCPFCGGEAEIIENYTGNEGYVECPHCHIGTQVYEYNELQEAIEAWNHRIGDANKTIVSEVAE